MNRAAAMGSARRISLYRLVNGTLRLTSRQLRRVRHKANHGMAPFGSRPSDRINVDQSI